MVVSEKKPIEELLGYLKGAKKVVLVGCGDCASACKTGGEPEIAEMKETLAANGIEVTGSVIIPTACNLLLGKKELKAVKDALKEADAVVSMACGDGTQTIMKNVKKIYLFIQQTILYSSVKLKELVNSKKLVKLVENVNLDGLVVYAQ